MDLINQGPFIKKKSKVKEFKLSPQNRATSTTRINDIIKSPMFILGNTDMIANILKDVQHPKSILKTKQNKEIQRQNEAIKQIGFKFNDHYYCHSLFEANNQLQNNES